MQDLQTRPTSTATGTPWKRITARWMLTFLGFPVGGYAATLLLGRVDTLTAAVLGGLITGAVIGAVQAWALRPAGPSPVRWITATAVGLAVGLGVGASVVSFATDLSSLLLQGAFSGLGVGAAQAVILRRPLGRLALAWPPALAAIWALGWLVSTSIGIRVEEQFIVFGASGALVVTALTAVLPVALNRTRNSAP